MTNFTWQKIPHKIQDVYRDGIQWYTQESKEDKR